MWLNKWIKNYTIGVELLNTGRTAQGIEELQTFVREQPDLLEVMEARIRLGKEFADQKRWAERLDSIPSMQVFFGTKRPLVSCSVPQRWSFRYRLPRSLPRR